MNLLSCSLDGINLLGRHRWAIWLPGFSQARLEVWIRHRLMSLEQRHGSFVSCDGSLGDGRVATAESVAGLGNPPTEATTSGGLALVVPRPSWNDILVWPCSLWNFETGVRTERSFSIIFLCRYDLQGCFSWRVAAIHQSEHGVFGAK